MSQCDAFVSPAPGSASLLVTNLTGHPAVVVPSGFINGLPQAIMFTGGLYEEAAPLRVALAYQKVTDWHLKRPDMRKIENMEQKMESKTSEAELRWPEGEHGITSWEGYDF
jgi:hypothetical protein